MKVAVVGSRDINIKNIGDYIPKNTTEIISGGAVGVDSCAEIYAHEKGIDFIKFIPEYERYGKAAPIVRNRLIIDRADLVIAFWNGKSKGTKNVIDICSKSDKEIMIVYI